MNRLFRIVASATPAVAIYIITGSTWGTGLLVALVAPHHALAVAAEIAGLAYDLLFPRTPADVPIVLPKAIGNQ